MVYIEQINLIELYMQKAIASEYLLESSKQILK